MKSPVKNVFEGLGFRVLFRNSFRKSLRVTRVRLGFFKDAFRGEGLGFRV